MSQRLNMASLFHLAPKTEKILRSLTETIRYQDLCKRVGIQERDAPWKYRYSQILEQVLDHLSITELLTGVKVKDQINRKIGTIPFHLIVNETGKPGSGYHKWWEIKEYKRP
jgi:hypothetical protein